MRLEIELPGQLELPKGCDRAQWCRPKNGDWYLNSQVKTTGEVVTKWWQYCGTQANYCTLVAVPIWTPPAAWSQLYWGWLTRDGDNGKMCIHDQEPVYDKPGEQWASNGQVDSLCLIRPDMQIPADIPAYKCCFYLGEQRDMG
jgi:hypothetical protein